MAALIVTEYPSMKVVYEDYHYEEEIDAPYIPGFLAQREIPMYTGLMSRLRKKQANFWPQVIFVDG